MNDEHTRLRMAYELEKATEFLKDLDRLNTQVGPAMTEDVDRAMRSRSARLEASGQVALARSFLAVWNNLSAAAQSRTHQHDQVAADLLDDAIERFERVWAETEAWFDATDSDSRR